MTAKEASAIDRKIAAIKSEQDYVARNTAAWVQQIIIDQLEQLKPQIESEKQDYAKQLLEKVKTELKTAFDKACKDENDAKTPKYDSFSVALARGAQDAINEALNIIDSVIKSEGKSGR